MLETNPGWEERAARLCIPDNFPVLVSVKPDVLRQVTIEEFARLQQKFVLVCQFAARLCAGMAKGTVKYPGDDYDLATWEAAALDDYADAINYRLLLDNARERTREAADYLEWQES